MDTQAEISRENEAFEAGVSLFVEYLDAEPGEPEIQAHNRWSDWSNGHRSMWVDAQTEARRRWMAAK